MRMDRKLVCRSDGRKGGLLLLWKKEIDVVMLELDPMFIDVSITEGTNTWRLTGMYGEFRWEEKYKTWDRMYQLHLNQNLPWLLIGDLIEIKFLHEKEGGNPRPQCYMQDFQTAIEDFNLGDMGFIGDPFTWHRGRIRERLDRGSINDEWALLFSAIALEHLQFARSDHRPLLFNTNFYANLNGGGTAKPLRFEACWLQEQTFSNVVKEA